MNKLYEIWSKSIFPSDPATGTLGSINLNVFMMQLSGIPLFGTKKESKGFKIFLIVYSTCVIITMTFLYTGLEVHDFISCLGNLNDLTQNACLLLPHIASVMKVINAFFRRKDILRIINQFKLLTKRYVVSEEQKEAFFWGEFENKIPLMIYSSIAAVTITTAIVIVMFNPQNFAGKRFPFRVKMPDFLPMNFQLAYMCLGVCLCGLQIVSLDYLNVTLINQIRYQMKILDIAFDRLTVSDERDINANSNLEALVGHHNILLGIRKDVESIFKFPVLLQFLTSLLIFALTGFQATVQSESTGLLLIYFYCICIFWELFVYCWFGNEVSEQNKTLSLSAYKSSWYDFDQRYKKSLLTFIMNAQKPFYFTAGGFANLSLETFTNILVKSYTFIAFLRQIYAK